jgi:CRP/FNR family transcriptional regulator, anaerobic regulatory protein
VSNTSEYAVQALTPLKLCVFADLHLDKLFREQVGLLESFSRTQVHDQRRLYERLVSLGRRSAAQGLAHLMLELADRAQARSFGSSTRYPFPLRRQHLADALGLSGTQVSRSAAELRDRRLAEFGHGALVILDRRALEKLADYSRPTTTAYRFIL